MAVKYVDRCVIVSSEDGSTLQIRALVGTDPRHPEDLTWSNMEGDVAAFNSDDPLDFVKDEGDTYWPPAET